MRKNSFTLLSLLVLVAFACSEEESRSLGSANDEKLIEVSENNIVQKSYEFNNQEYFVDFILEGNSVEPVSGERDYDFIKSLLDKPESVLYFNYL